MKIALIKKSDFDKAAKIAFQYHFTLRVIRIESDVIIIEVAANEFDIFKRFILIRWKQ